jgi:hypothetical protein
MCRVVIFVAVLLILPACQTDSDNPFEPGDVVDTTLVITGTASERWTGAISDDDGIRSMEGIVPQIVVLRARENSFVGGTIQKDTDGGWLLNVCIALNGVDKRCNQTTARFGVVSVSGRIEDKRTLD